MEAIAAFALACNVIQIVDSSIKIAGKCREVYKDGISVENEELVILYCLQ